MKHPSSEVAGVVGGVGAIALVALCCALPVLAPIGLVVGVGVAGSAALSRAKRRHKVVGERDSG